MIAVLWIGVIIFSILDNILKFSGKKLKFILIFGRNGCRSSDRIRIHSKAWLYVIQALKKDIDKNREKKEVTVLILGTKNDLTESRRVDYLQVGFAFHQYNKATYICTVLQYNRMFLIGRKQFNG